MARVVPMPKLGLTMKIGQVVEWKKDLGEAVARGDVIAEIMTEKITYELEADSDGVLLQVVVPAGDEARPGDPIAIIGQPGEDVSGLGGAAAPPPVTEAAPVEPASVSSGVGAAAGSTGERVKASPAAKKLAAELAVDLALVTGTGPEGRVTIDDVQAAAAAPRAEVVAAGNGTQLRTTPLARKMAAEAALDLTGLKASVGDRVTSADVMAALSSGSDAERATETFAVPGKEAVEEIPYRGMRRSIGEHMATSQTVSATVTHHVRADVHELMQLLATVNEGRESSDKINVTAAVVKAAALALRQMPRVNATLDGDTIKIWSSVNVGVAVALAEGLMVPVIRDADTKAVAAISREIRELAGKAREGSLQSHEITGGTFTVTSVGSYKSVDWFTPIINQPEAAILGVGRLRDDVVAVDGAPAVRQTLGLSLTFDHRIVDGAPAAEFLKLVLDYLGGPLSMLF